MSEQQREDTESEWAERNKRWPVATMTRVIPSVESMSLRDWFAGQYMSGRIARSTQTPEGIGPSWDLDQLAVWAYAAADAMLKARQ